MDGGLVRCLGVMADARLPSAPDVPTFREMGTDWALGGWRGLVFPKEVPAERVARMREAVLRVARSDELAEYMRSAGFNLSVAGPEEFSKLLASMDEPFGTILSCPAFARISQAPFGPMVFPGVVIGVGAMALLVLLWRGRLKLPSGTVALRRQELLRLSWVPAAVVFFIVAAGTAGFVIAAGVLLASLLLALRVRVLTTAVLTIVFVPAVYHIFAVVLGVPLPWGWLGW